MNKIGEILLYTAIQYDIIDLINVCIEYYINSINIDNVMYLYRISQKYMGQNYNPSGVVVRLKDSTERYMTEHAGVLARRYGLEAGAGADVCEGERSDVGRAECV